MGKKKYGRGRRIDTMDLGETGIQLDWFYYGADPYPVEGRILGYGENGIEIGIGCGVGDVVNIIEYEKGVCMIEHREYAGTRIALLEMLTLTIPKGTKRIEVYEGRNIKPREQWAEKEALYR